MCQACDRSRHSVVMTARRLRPGCATAPSETAVPTIPALTALTKARLEIMAGPFLGESLDAVATRQSLGMIGLPPLGVSEWWLGEQVRRGYALANPSAVEPGHSPLQ